MNNLLFTTLVFAAALQAQSINQLDFRNVKAEPVDYKGHKAVRITESTNGDGPDVGEAIAIVKGTSFQDGTIEVNVTGDTAPNAAPTLRGFVGIAFRLAADPMRFECFYIRPKNGRSDDQLQRNHSAQYVSVPGFPWQKLREETPGKYESYVDLVPGEWTRLKIEVNGSKARLFVGDAPQPVLVVNDLKQPVQKGAVALWVGPGTIAHFRDLEIH